MNSMPFRQLKSFLKILIGVQYKALSVTFGDSSPRGRAKGLMHEKWSVSVPIRSILTTHQKRGRILCLILFPG